MASNHRLPIRLLVISHKRHNLSSEERICVEGGFARFKSEFAQHVTHLRLCVPVGQTENISGATTYPHNVSICQLKPYRGRMGFFGSLPDTLKKLWYETGRADLVYAMCPNDMGLLGLAVARARGKPVFISIDTDRAGKARIRKDFKWWANLKAWIITQTIYRTLIGLASNRPGFVTGNPFMGDVPGWRQWIKTTVTSRDILPFRDITHTQLTTINIVFIGRLSYEKNIDCLIEASALYARQGRSISVKVVGDGDQRSRLEKLKNNLHADFIQFMGSISNEELTRNRLLGADVLVLPSREERQGKVLLEAMAASIPVIASNAGGIPAIIEHEFNGLLFNPDIPAELTEALRRVADDPSLRSILVKNGYNFATKHTLDHTVAQIMEEVRDFYNLPIPLEQLSSCKSPSENELHK